MRILHVFDHSLPVQSGYSFRSFNILREQRKLGWQTLQVTGSKHGEVRSDPEKVHELEFYRTRSTGGVRERLPVLNQLEVVRTLKSRVRQLVREHRPDIIHAHSPCLNGLAVLGHGVPVVYEMRATWEDGAVVSGTTTQGSLRYRLSRALETHVLRRADAVITICDGLRKEVIGRGVAPERIAVAYNGVDPDAFSIQSGSGAGIRAKYGLDGKYVLGFVGSLFAWEGLGLLVEALPAVLARRPDVRLLLVGGGVDEPALRSAVERLGLQSQVIFAERVPHSQVGALYDAIDLLVYPRLPMRLTEIVTPLKPLEAMALGKPFIASDVGGHRELVVDGETGLLFRAGDAAALSAAILRISENPQLERKLRAAGPPHVRERWTWAHTVKPHAAVYERVLGRKRA